jgi:SSS family solute:Na+ symporter
LLGLFSRVAFEQGMFTDIGFAANTAFDPELGLPLLLSHILPVGLMGLMMSAYFSAIMSTADSCLMAASGNLITDILDKIRPTKEQHSILKSQLITFIIGVIAIALSTVMTSVLDLMLYSYAFMVSGLFVPVLGTLIYKKPNSSAALLSMIFGGSTTLLLILFETQLPWEIDANFFGISISAIIFLIVQNTPKTNAQFKTVG